MSDFVRDHSFGLVLSVLLLAGVGWGIYVWLQIQSPAIFAPKPAPILSAPAPAVQTPAQPLELAASPVTASEDPTPAAPAASIEQPATAESSAKPPPAPEQKSEKVTRETLPAPSPEAVAKKPTAVADKAAPAPRVEQEIIINRAIEAPAERSLVNQAYDAFQNGDYQAAKTLYQEAWRAQPKNADSLLGLAAIAAFEGNHAQASQLYFKALELEPKNPVAQAGVISLLGRADPTSSEARLKSLVAKEPSAHLYSVLGDLYSEQSRWGDAQAAYFQAHHLAPDNQDYAYNLAVSLEHVSQPKLALTYYRKALDLARERASFDRIAVQARIAELQSLEK
jgi:tetratricopeptide (TPR) repeat protein